MIATHTGHGGVLLAPYPRNDGLDRIRAKPPAADVTPAERSALALRDAQEASASRAWSGSDAEVECIGRLVVLKTCTTCGDLTVNLGGRVLCSWACAQAYGAQMALNGYWFDGSWATSMRFRTGQRCASYASVCLGNVNFYEVGI